ncbi:MAG: hypothetical protein AAF721_12655 [Myxococcota bacterium]
MQPLRCSRASQVFEVCAADERFIAKTHRVPAAFERECNALRWGQASGAVPQLLDADPGARMLLMAYVPERQQPAPIDGVAYALGRLHEGLAAGARADGAQRLGAAARTPPGWVVDADAYVEAVTRYAGAVGFGHVAVAIGDIKAEHIRGDAEVVFIDLETFSPGVVEHMDVLTLANLTDAALGGAEWSDILAAYWRGRGLAPPGGLGLQLEVLRAAARAVGEETTW